MYISRLCYMYDVSVRLSVRLSVTEVHWCIIANLGFKFRSHFRLLHIAAAVLLVGGSSRAMLASARLSCFSLWYLFTVSFPLEFRSAAIEAANGHFFSSDLQLWPWPTNYLQLRWTCISDIHFIADFVRKLSFDYTATILSAKSDQ